MTASSFLRPGCSVTAVSPRATRWATVALACSLAACTRKVTIDQAPTSAQNSTAATASAIDAIKRTGAEFSRLYMRGDARGMAAIYTEDGAILPPGRPIIKGRQAIEQYWTLGPGVTVVEHRTTPDSIIVRGDIAYDWGTYLARNARDGQPGNPAHGKYVIVWRVQPDGRWLMHLDIWNGSPAPSP